MRGARQRRGAVSPAVAAVAAATMAAMAVVWTAAEAAGVPILCEAGLDPGMDHMSAQRLINDVKAAGGIVSSFSSVCGGLPAPECASDNPFM